MQYQRQLKLQSLLQENSFFLFGPRATGKSFLIKKTLSHAQIFNLLDDDTFDSLMRRPKSLSEQIKDFKKIIVIDEIQKLPKLLDEVHRLIEDYGAKFLLTGSSARKLRHGGANLLAGRAWEAHLFPLVYPEIPDFDLVSYINYGGLPRVVQSVNPKEELKAYVKIYLNEEIKAEAWVRSYEKFVRFLETMALSNGKELNYQTISSDAGVPARTLEGYIEVLRDTLIGNELLPFTKTKKRKAVTRSKFYFFDLGVVNSLKGIGPLTPKNTDFGDAFEHFILNEIRAYNNYSRKDEGLYYWRTREVEVDFIVGNKAAIEIKSSERIKDSYFSGLKKLKEEQLISNYYLVSLSHEEGKHDGINFLFYETFLKKLWSGEIF
ncbi:MAG: AAA family ATPase [Bdellovibrionia bacterium]